MEYGFHNGIFDELIRPRETIARFSERRSILSEDPQKTLQELFDYYVGRNFVTREYQETILEKGIKKLLEQRSLASHFSKRKVEDHLYSVTFPFVEQDADKVIKVIKPLFLGQADSTAIIEHGGHWKLKVNQLRKRNLLNGPVLFPVKGLKTFPLQTSGSRHSKKHGILWRTMPLKWCYTLKKPEFWSSPLISR